MAQLSHPYMTTGKTIALTLWTLIGKVMSLLFNMLSRFVIAFLSRSKCLLIAWLQSPSAVILQSKKIKSVTVSIVFPSICMKWWDQIPSVKSTLSLWDLRNTDLALHVFCWPRHGAWCGPIVAGLICMEKWWVALKSCALATSRAQGSTWG